MRWQFWHAATAQENLKKRLRKYEFRTMHKIMMMMKFMFNVAAMTWMMSDT